ncbi:hypothetical protein ACFV9C_32730 [Kribbella sp. NPDC059898]|uniref:hypothetical protein n=1 Tax=Kribbella sp. NPDC059898 TaxID=3346995 RepID=UPI0036662FE2
MRTVETYASVVGLVVHAETGGAHRQREDPARWTIPAFTGHRLTEMLRIESNLPDSADPAADHAALSGEAVASADEHLLWRSSRAEAFRPVPAEVWMVCGACDV